MRGCPDCPRGLNTCLPLDNVISDEGSPVTFVCVGFNDGSDRQLDQDHMTLCWKNSETDVHEHVDRFDLGDQLAVIASALTMDERLEQMYAEPDGAIPQHGREQFDRYRKAIADSEQTYPHDAPLSSSEKKE